MEPAGVFGLASEHLDHEAAVTATAIAWAESGLDPQALGDVDLQDDKWGPSCGLWQIRSLRADTGTGRPRDRERLLDPVFNAAAMASISGGTDWSPWSMFNNGRYLDHIDTVRAAVKETPVAEVPSAEKALGWLRSHLGTGENPPGSNHNFITDWGRLGAVAWCDICFWASECVAWGVYDSRRLPDNYPIATDYSWGDAYVPSTRYHFRAAGSYSRIPVIGAAVIFRWDGAPEVSTLSGAPWVEAPDLPPVDVDPPGPPEETRGPRPPFIDQMVRLVAFEDIGDHIGRVEAWVDRTGNQRTDECVLAEWDQTVITLEGNADNDLVRKRRPLTLIDGFGAMPYPQPPTPEPEEAEGMKLIAVTEDRGIFLAGENVGEDGRIPARHVGTPDEVTALVDSGAVSHYDKRPALPASVFDTYYRVVG